MTQKNDSFFEKVYDVVRLVPFGRVTTYGAIARFIGSAQSSRMVGWALNASHSFTDVPAHRVVNRNGMLTGKQHFGTSDTMQELLENEGVEVVENKIIYFEKLFWDPMSEYNKNSFL